MTDIKYNGNLFVVLCKNPNKVRKYFKINKIRKKILLDINKMAKGEGLPYDEAIQYDFFKLLILKEIHTAMEKNKDIYYMPHFQEDDEAPEKVLRIKNMIKEHNYSFNLLYLYDDFDMPKQATKILENIDVFDYAQILKDY